MGGAQRGTLARAAWGASCKRVRAHKQLHKQRWTSRRGHTAPIHCFLGFYGIYICGGTILRYTACLRSTVLKQPSCGAALRVRVLCVRARARVSRHRHTRGPRGPSRPAIYFQPEAAS